RSPAPSTTSDCATDVCSSAPAANYSGPDSFTYKANDGTADSNVATVSIAVGAVNDAPVAGGDSYTATEDTALAIAAPGVLANDSSDERRVGTAVGGRWTAQGE